MHQSQEFSIKAPNARSLLPLVPLVPMHQSQEFSIKDPNAPLPPCSSSLLPLVQCTKSQEFSIKDPKFDLLGLDCTGDASESGLIKCFQVLRDVDEYAK